MAISKRSRYIKNTAKKLGHIPQGVLFEEIMTARRESYAAYEKNKKPVSSADLWKSFDKPKKEIKRRKPRY